MRWLLGLLVFLLVWVYEVQAPRQSKPDYRDYHTEVIRAETFIAEGLYSEALARYDQLFITYSFVFLRDYKIAAQLALELGDRKKAFSLIKKGISAGWELKSLKKQRFLAPLRGSPEWEALEASYPELRKSYESRLDPVLRTRVQKMFKKDQKKAMGALFRIGDKAQEKYALKTFAPHSEQQLRELLEIVNTAGYPGEQLIGNDYWASTILSHHNSITREYALQDTLFEHIKPGLFSALRAGTMSPYEFALADDWHIAVSSDRQAPGYGFLQPPSKPTIAQTNQLRERIGLRSIALRNALVEMEGRTGMDFYLPDWVDGAIPIESH